MQTDSQGSVDPGSSEATRLAPKIIWAVAIMMILTIASGLTFAFLLIAVQQLEPQVAIAATLKLVGGIVLVLVAAIALLVMPSKGGDGLLRRLGHALSAFLGNTDSR